MSFREVDSPVAALAYVEDLNRRWPTRHKIVSQIIDDLADTSANQMNVLELCCGSGFLAAALLERYPRLRYWGIDQSRPLLQAAEEQIGRFGERATFVQADLNKDYWFETNHVNYRPPIFQAIVSMQSVHDLGGQHEVSQLYRRVRPLLAHQGLFINADLIVECENELPNNPGRLPISLHVRLLTRHGYNRPQCTFEEGGFGYIVARG